MSKKKQSKIEGVDEQIKYNAKVLLENKTGGLEYRVRLYHLEHWLSIRKGLQHLKETRGL